MSEEKDEVVEVPEKFKEMVATIEKMSVLDLAELVKVLEKKFGVSAAAPVAMAAPVAGAGAAVAEEKTEFNVELTACGTNKIAVIKIVREITGKGLKESKDLVDKAPQIVKEGADKATAEDIKKKIEEAGGTVVLK